MIGVMGFSAQNGSNLDLRASGGGVMTVPTDGFAASRGTLQEDRSVPLMIPAGQAYFWSAEWQRGEAESAAARSEGAMHEFDSATDLIRWLLTPDQP